MNNTTPTGTEAGFDPDKLETEIATVTDWLKDGNPYIREAVARIVALARRAAPDSAAKQCVICGADEPRTGTCGSDDPRALCNRPDSAAQPDTTASASIAEKDAHIALLQNTIDHLNVELEETRAFVAQLVQAGDAVDVKPWGDRLPLCPDEHQIRAAMEAEIAELRASLAPVSAQQGAAEGIERIDSLIAEISREDAVKAAEAFFPEESAAKAPAAQAVDAAQENAFIDAMPTISREEADHPNDTGSPNWRALAHGDNLARCIAAAFAASPASTPETATEQTITIDGRTYTAAEIKGRILQLMHDVEVLDKLVTNAGREIEAAYAQQPAAPDEHQWRNIRKVINEVAKYCFGGPSQQGNVSMAVAYTCVTTCLTAKDGLRVELEHLATTAGAAETSEWANVVDQRPLPGQEVLVMSENWARPAVLKYQAQPHERFLDAENGRWYWHPERMRWAALPPFDSATQQEGE